MTEKTAKTEFDISLLPEPADIGDIVMNLMVNPNLSPLNYFNDFTDGGDDIDSLKEGRYNESNFFDAGDGKKFMSMTIHAMNHHLDHAPNDDA